MKYSSLVFPFLSNFYSSLHFNIRCQLIQFLFIYKIQIRSIKPSSGASIVQHIVRIVTSWFCALPYPQTTFLCFLSEVSASLFACDFEVQGLKSLCGWKDDPRDNGAVWSIVWNPDIHTNILCMTLATSSHYATDDDDDFGFDGIKEHVMRAKLWSPKFYAAKTDAVPQCVKFSFKFDQLDSELSSSLSLMRHSVR